MTTPHRDGIALLVESLKVRRPLLFVGAGVSANAGYPLWAPLVRQLANTFCHGFVHTGNDLHDVDLITDAAEKAGRGAELLKFLERTFSWDSATNKDLRFPRRLISLGFAGLLTTNFDPSLEYAVAEEYSRPGDIRICEPVDVLNKDLTHRVGAFLRDVDRTDPEYRRVLHLHGYHAAPRHLVLGERSYTEAYGYTLTGDNTNLQTLLTKMIWSLGTTRSFVFVGFSLMDQFFNRALDCVRRDILLTDEPAHFAIMGYDVDLPFTDDRDMALAAHEEAKSRIRTRLPDWVVPIFYHAPTDPVNGRNHQGLPAIIEDVAERLKRGTDTRSMVDKLADRALEEL